MKITYCDKCGEQLNSYHFHMTYSGNNEIELCEECATDFKLWLNCDTLADRLEKACEDLLTIIANAKKDEA